MAHPYSDVAIAGIYNTRQARRLPDESAISLAVEATVGACADAGIEPAEIDGVIGQNPGEIIYELGLGPALRFKTGVGLPSISVAALLISSGQASVVACVGAAAGSLDEMVADGSTAAWTRPENEMVASYGLHTAAEMALMARAHMNRFGTTREQMAHAAAVIRNNGSAHPGAVYTGRGPFDAATIAASPPVADPFCVLDCATTSEGGAALVLCRADRVRDLAAAPAYILGAASDAYASAYTRPPSFDLAPRGGREAGSVGRRAAQMAFDQAGLGTADVDVCEFYDPFSFEIIRQYEAFGFCADGEGGDFVTSGAIEPGGRFPVTTDGGTMSFSHAGVNTQMLQRAIRGVEQVRGTAASVQVGAAEVAMCTGGGSGALFCDVLLVGSVRP